MEKVESQVKIMTLNIWNYNDPWTERLNLITKTVGEEDPDIIGFQEIRSDIRFDVDGKNQIEQIAQHLPAYDFVFERAQIDDETRWEGLAIMSKYRITSSSHIKLSRDRDDPGDWRHQRIVLQAEIDLPVGSFHFFDTHMSLSEGGRDRTIVEVADFIHRFESDLPKVIVGDFNASPDQKSIRFMTGKLEINSKKALFQDAWKAIYPDDEKPTYRAIDNLERRIDYIFVTPDGKIISCDLTANKPDERGLYPSDHLGLVARIQLGA